MQRQCAVVLLVLACSCDFRAAAPEPAAVPTAVPAQADEYPHLKMGNPSKARDDPADRDNFLMKKKFFALSYNNHHGTPNWVSWRLLKEDLGDAPRAQFHPDTALPAGFKRIVPRDYTGSGFDRGHICPHSDRAFSAEASNATFLMTNMIPQAPNVNQGAWNDLEDYLRQLVRRDDHRLYIVSGPAGKGGVGKEGRRELLADGRVTVPAYCWKVVLVLPEGNERDDIDKVFARTRVIAVIMPNDDSVQHNWPKYRTSVRKVEELTGYTFFDRVPAETINPLKEKVDEVQVRPSRPRGRGKQADK